MNLSSRSLTVDGRTVHALVGGSGSPHVLLHGWGSAAERYRAAFDALPETAGRWWIPDLPGFGTSPRPEKTWGLNDYADWTKRFFDAAGVTKPIVVGHSFGGSLGILLAAEPTTTLRGLVLYAPGHLVEEPPARLSLFRTLAQSGKRVLDLPGLRALSPIARRALYRLAGTQDYLRVGQMKDIFERVIREFVDDRVPHVSIPVVLLWGEQDRVTPLREAESILARLPHADRVLIPHAGHAPHLEDPKAFAEYLARALTRLESLMTGNTRP